ncbi:hypothetical protein NJC10_01265 [Micrococcus sp. M4NT]|uniref:hypothetical protein n=1 Tax=Micrococcus sp. M4NT TaxID=2957501 RepID=UPI0029B8C027|nr:hypothetical protein [Micrococcus sp. M4NT]MDX2340308.1 hypothetical protein [Micrococcus sp. M4NT]
MSAEQGPPAHGRAARGSGPRRGRSRRADAPGTGPTAADGPEPRVVGLDGADARAPRSSPRPGAAGQAPAGQPVAAMDEHDRWLLEQRPPHWG